MALEIIGAGFGRTGTLSMKAALEQLGYGTCHHMFEVMSNDEQLDTWHRISQGEAPDWDKVFEGFGASVDFPSAGYWREIAAHYPDAKIVLTSRDFDGWYASASETIWAFSEVISGWMMMIPKVRKIREMVYAAIWDRIFHGKFADKAAARQVFEQHEADVEQAFGPDRLLVFHPKQGWEPLCAFLGKPVPDSDFPNLNDRDEFIKRNRLLRRLSYLPYGLAAIAAVLIAYLVFR